VEPVEWPGDLHEPWPLCLESLPDRALGQFGMLVRFGVSDASVEQPSIQLLVARHPQPRREEVRIPGEVARESAMMSPSIPI